MKLICLEVLPRGVSRHKDDVRVTASRPVISAIKQTPQINGGLARDRRGARSAAAAALTRQVEDDRPYVAHKYEPVTGVIVTEPARDWRRARRCGNVDQLQAPSESAASLVISVRNCVEDGSGVDGIKGK